MRPSSPITHLQARALAIGLVPLLALVLTPPTHAAADAAVARLMDQGHWTRARAALQPQLTAHPDDAGLLAQMARVEQAFGDLDAAERHASRAVELAPGDAAAHAALASVSGQKAGKAGALSQLGLARRFKKEAEAALAIDPALVETRLDLISFYMVAPGIAGGDKKKAHAIVDEAVATDAPWAWRARERLASQEKDSTAFAAIYRDATTKRPDDYRAQIAYANWLGAPWRSPAEAETHARAALALDPDRIGGYTLLAVFLAKNARWDELDALLAEAEKRVPDDLSPCYQAGRVALVDHGDGARAEHWFRHYLSHPPEAGAVTTAAAHWRLGLALEKQGRATDARAEVELAARLDPKFEPAQKDLKRMKG